ncbi:response regulator [Novosphingobium sp. BL-8H]|uniref:response regulator n=1 Tax=Novosphingobium sp. BL-8H TaxID=3127640 RepID=UPI003756BF3A
MADSLLEGRTILVVEDEYFIALDLEAELCEAGVNVVGPAASVVSAMELIHNSGAIDGAVVDINLAGEMAFSLADVLHDRGVPFIFATGCDKTSIPERFGQIPLCGKPSAFRDLQRSLEAIMA